MNSILLNDEKGVITDQKVLTHLLQTLKLKIADTVKITVLNRGTGTGIIKIINSDFCQIEILKLTPASNPWIDLIVGVSRPQTMKKIIEHGTTYGVNSFHFYKADLSEKSYLDSKVFQTDSAETETFSHLAKLGLSQSTIYAQLPSISLYTYHPGHVFKDYQQKFILDLNTDKTFSHYHQSSELNLDLPLAISIGPERGFTLNDIEHFHQAGFKSVTISSTVLRVEHAAYSAIAQLELLKLSTQNQGTNIC